jgi:hypothetical protein
MQKRGTISAKGLLLAGGLALIAGCAEDTRGTWENANLPRERWRTDEAECRDAARERAEREFALRQFEQPPTGGYSRNEPVVSSLNQFEARRRIEELFERCMTDRGYRSVARSKDD